MENNNQHLLKPLFQFTEAMVNQLGDEQKEIRDEILNQLGPGIADKYSGNSENYQHLKKLANPQSEEDITAMTYLLAMADLAKLSNSIRAFVEPIVQASGKIKDNDRLISDYLAFMLDLLSQSALQQLSPPLHAFFRLLVALEDSGNRAGGSGYALTRVVRNWGSKVGKTTSTPEGAQALSELIFTGVIGGIFLLDLFGFQKLKNKMEMSAQFGFHGVVDELSAVDNISNRILSVGFKTNGKNALGKADLGLYCTMVLLSEEEGGGAMHILLNGNFNQDHELSPGTTLKFDSVGGGHFRIGSNSKANATDDTHFIMKFEHKPKNAKIIDIIKKPRFGIGLTQFISEIELKPDDFICRIKGKFKILLSGGTGFPGNLLPKEGIDFETPLLDIAFSFKNGLTVLSDKPTKKDRGLETKSEGGVIPAFDIKFPTHLVLGPVVINGGQLMSKSDSKEQFTVALSMDFTLKFGKPLSISVTGMGLKLDAKKVEKGGVFGFDLKPDIKPPTGAGVRVKTDAVTGGGYLFFNFDKGEYLGALDLDVKGMFALKAIGILRTKDDAGKEAFSLLLLITAEFSPIQLGFGFTLMGVGGMLGLNRGVDVGYLQSGMKSGVLQSILFPKDPVGNIHRIIRDLNAAFPMKQDSFVIGIMGKIGYGSPTIMTIEIGLILVVPDPVILLPGVLRATFPDEKTPVLKLGVNFLGVLNFREKYIFFRADLFDSRLLTFTLTGSMALGISWGDNGMFVFSIGGFHPRFMDRPTLPGMPDAFANMDRLAIHLIKEKQVRLGIETYFAITSNTVQFGAKAELYAHSGIFDFNVYGRLEFNALFFFKPFRFEFDIAAEIALRDGENWIIGIGLYGWLSGPEPWNLRGKARITIVIVDVTVDVNLKWGNNPVEKPLETAQVSIMLKQALEDDRNWRFVLPSGKFQLATIAESPNSKENTPIPLRSSPIAVPEFLQSVAPLNYKMAKYGEQKPDFEQFDLKAITVNQQPIGTSSILYERFAPEQFRIMDEAERLSSPSFQNMAGGFRADGLGGAKTGNIRTINVAGEIAEKRRSGSSINSGSMKLTINDLSQRYGTAVHSSVQSEKNRYAQGQKPIETMPINKNRYAVASIDTLKNVLTPNLFVSKAEAEQAMHEQERTLPTLKEKLIVVEAYELAG
jgi:hypothetical protein